MGVSPPRLLFVVNQLRFFVSHRLPIALGAKQAGYEVHVAYGEEGDADALAALAGIPTHRVPMVRGGTDPADDIRTVVALWRLFRTLRPSLVHLVTLKPVLYGGVAARLARVPGVVAAVAGLGFTFIGTTGWRPRALRAVMRPLFRAAFQHPNLRLILQNPDDAAAVAELARLSTDHIRIVKGSGVDVGAIAVRPEPDGTPVVAMASRLLYDKGVSEFVEAARLLHGRGVAVRFWLIGGRDAANPASIEATTCDRWRADGHVELMGHRTDVLELYARAHLVALPSYREGLPKALVEAAACGRAVVTTDVPGCRDAIVPGVTGLLVPPRNAVALADAIEALCSDAGRRRQMGAAGRRLAEAEFGIERIVQSHLATYAELR